MILSSGWTLFVMAGLFLGLGYLGVPVPFAIMAGVFVATMLTPADLAPREASDRRGHFGLGERRAAVGPVQACSRSRVTHGSIRLRSRWPDRLASVRLRSPSAITALTVLRQSLAGLLQARQEAGSAARPAHWRAECHPGDDRWRWHRAGRRCAALAAPR